MRFVFFKEGHEGHRVGLLQKALNYGKAANKRPIFQAAGRKGHNIENAFLTSNIEISGLT